MTRVALIWHGDRVKRVCDSRDDAEAWVDEYAERPELLNITTRDVYEA
jgi:hypothetical protein